MADRYDGPCGHDLIVDDVCNVDFFPFNVAIAFLTLMFVPVARRRWLIELLRNRCNAGGEIIVLDKCEATGGYAGTVL